MGMPHSGGDLPDGCKCIPYLFLFSIATLVMVCLILEAIEDKAYLAIPLAIGMTMVTLGGVCKAFGKIIGKTPVGDSAIFKGEPLKKHPPMTEDSEELMQKVRSIRSHRRRR